jgi:thiol-disulfide isomerase/thioredoxin
MPRAFIYARLLLVALLSVPLVAGAEALSWKTPAGDELDLTRYPAEGEALLLWLPSESGTLKQEHAQARRLARTGVEVWLADLHTSYLLPAVSSSIDEIPAHGLAGLVQHIRMQTGKKVYLLASGRGAVLALRAAHLWQQQHPDELLDGVILISPKFFVRTPPPGEQGALYPVVSATNLPVFIIQATNSPWRWKLDRTVPALEEGGSDVFVRILPGVRDRFYYRPDATPLEEAMAKRFPRLLREAISLVQSIADKPRPVSGAVVPKLKTVPETARPVRALRPYHGDTRPPELRLADLNGQSRDLKDFAGQVVLVNFWATWCPPCVHEMPSMQRLQQRFAGKPFTILAVNMAEDQPTIRRFLREKVAVDFPILLDRDGAALKRWEVFAFPTSYVIGKRGQIRYALFGAIDWEEADVIRKIGGLLEETP